MRFGSFASKCIVSAVSIITLGCLTPELTGGCPDTKPIASGDFESIPKLGTSPYPLATTTAQATLELDQSQKTVTISYTAQGKAVVEQYRLK